MLVNSLTNHCVLASSGMHADAVALRKHLSYVIKEYEFDHEKKCQVHLVVN